MNFIKKILYTVASLIRALKILKFMMLSGYKKIGLYNDHIRKPNECVVLANGPSLKNDMLKNLDFFRDKDIFCMNDFAISEYYTKIRPRYYLLTDPSYYGKNVVEFFENTRTGLFNSIINKTNWKMTILSPHYATSDGVIDRLCNNKNIDVVYFNATPVRGGWNKFNFLFFKNNLGAPSIQNTLIAGIFTAINMGFKKVFVFGADHSWTESMVVSKKNILCTKKGYRFYDEGDEELIPNVKDYVNNVTFKVHEFMQAMAVTFEGYFILEDYSKYMNAKVYNASSKTYIDAFERYNV